MSVHEGGEGERLGGTAILLGGAIFLFGVAFSTLMVLSSAWPSLVPFLIAALGFIVLAFGLWARCWPLRGRPASRVRRGSGWIAVVAIVVVALVWILNVGVTRLETHEMYWSYGRDANGVIDGRHIQLEFVEFPGHVSGIYSEELGPYLESLGADRVAVEFRVTRDFGRVRGFIEVRVGDLDHWDTRGGYMPRRSTSRTKGGIGPGPWDR